MFWLLLFQLHSLRRGRISQNVCTLELFPPCLSPKTALATATGGIVTSPGGKCLAACPRPRGRAENWSPVSQLWWFYPQFSLGLEPHVHFWCASSAPAMLLNYYYLTILPLITVTDGNQPWSCSLNSTSNSSSANGDDASHELALKASVYPHPLSYHSS